MAGLVALRLELEEVLQHFQANPLGLFGVELGGHDVIFPGGAGEVEPAVLGQGGGETFVLWHDVVAVDKIGAGSVGQALEERAIILDLNFVPAHVGDLERGGVGMAGEVKTDTLSGPDGQSAVAAVFVAEFKKQLEAQANAQEWLF